MWYYTPSAVRVFLKSKVQIRFVFGQALQWCDLRRISYPSDCIDFSENCIFFYPPVYKKTLGFFLHSFSDKQSNTETVKGGFSHFRLLIIVRYIYPYIWPFKIVLLLSQSVREAINLCPTSNIKIKSADGTVINLVIHRDVVKGFGSSLCTAFVQKL